MAENKSAAPKLIYESQESWYDQAVKAMNADRLIVQFAFKIENYLKAAEMFDQIADYQDAAQLAERCRELAELAKEEEKEYKYQLAVNQKKQAKSAKGYEKAEKLFNDVLEYKDVKQLLKECQENRKQLEKKTKAKKARKLFLMVIVLFGVVAFFLSPVWTSLKNRVLPEKIEDPRFAETKKEENKPTVKTAAAGDVVAWGDKEWYVLEADEKQAKLILLQGETIIENTITEEFSEDEQETILSMGINSYPVVIVSKE